MHQVWVIAKKDIKELILGKYYLYFLFLIFISLPYFDIVKNTLGDLSKQGASPDQLRLAAQSFIDFAAYTLPLSFSLFVCSMVASYSIATDKIKRALEPLLATPLNIRQIWIGKSIAVALPCLALGTLASFIVVLAVNLVIINPAVGQWFLPNAVPLVYALIISPLLVSLVVILVSLFQLITTNPKLPPLVFAGIYLMIYMSAIFGSSTGWNFNLIYILFITAVGLITLGVIRMLTKERVALSSKS